jgi:predicted DCC family thiol-disulfide oxidoreductase YuxK
MIQLLVMFLYADAFLWKIGGEQWMSGLAIYYTSRLPEFYRFPTPYLFEHLWTLKAMAWGTLVIEGALGLLLWVKELRYWILLSGVFLHLGIDWTMNIPLFAWVLMTAYLAWIAPADLERFFAWARERVNRWTSFAAPIPVFYDGRCGFCGRSVAVLKRFDSLRRMRFIDMHAPEARAEFGDLDLDRAANEMLLRDRDGKWFGGFDAYRVMARHMPGLWLTLPFLFVPPVPIIARRVYAWIAGRRYCILTPPVSHPQVVMGK